MDYQKIFTEIAIVLPKMADQGQVASYIPELQNVDANKLGII